MTVAQKVNAFLGKNGFTCGGPNINAVIDSLIWDMKKGLNEGRSTEGAFVASQDMIPTFAMPPTERIVNKNVIVIDAGGTNFRACLVHFDAEGTYTISDFKKTAMPGIEREYGKKEFYDTIAKNLDHLKGKADSIGFCFSYAMSITPEGDGRVLDFSKEIKAKEVVGSLVGESLSAALVERGWEKPKKIILLNDTAAALLSGAASAKPGRLFSSYVGLILGTGMNAAYIESNPIKKIAGQKAPESQIVVCETGKFDKLPQSLFDIAYDKTTNTPGMYIIEKMCSGAYLGPVTGFALKQAAKDGLFSEAVAKDLLLIEKFELKDMDQFFFAPYNTDTLLGAIMAKGNQDDYDTCYALLDAFVERTARLAASIIAACVIKSEKGTQASLPVCVVTEGTTYFKTHNLQDRVKGYLNTVLMEERGLSFELVSPESAITLGAAVAALS
ncbi:MAG TPA: hexokinase [Treponemataceae bacterium]|nr:hexokinase [Treponemataceae bacterium]